MTVCLTSLALLCSCAVDRAMKRESPVIEKEMASKAQVEPRPQAPMRVEPKEAPHDPLKGKTITLTAKNAPFSEIYAAIAQKAGLDLVIDSRLISAQPELSTTAAQVPSGVQGQSMQPAGARRSKIEVPTVSITFTKTPLDEALSSVDHALHLFSSVKRNTLHVKGTESRTFSLTFLSSQKETTIRVGGDVIGSSYLGSSSGSSSGSSGSSSGDTLKGEFSIKDTVTPSSKDIFAQVEETVKSCLSPYGTYSLNRALGFLEINDMRDTIERIDAYIKTLKAHYNSQVLITAKVIEVSLKDTSRYGIDWSSIHGTIRDYAFNPISQHLSLDTSTLTPALEIQVGSSKHGFDAALNALAEFGDIKVLSNPRIRVTNGQSALISVGTSSSYIQEIKVTTTSVEGGSTVITPEVTVGSIFDGVMLGVVPSIDLDNYAVNLSITPIKSRIVTLEERTVHDNLYTLPKVDLEEVSSQIRVKSGNIIALGGLISKDLATENTKVPILGDIPYLGYLFKQESKSVRTAELVILLEPVILSE